MAGSPSTYDLEVTARALVLLSQRGARRWSSVRFASALPSSRRSSDMLRFLERAGLVTAPDGLWHLTDLGQDVVAAAGAGDWGPFGLAVLRTGLYDEQLSRLLEGGNVSDGLLHCPIARLPRVAPVAGAVLAWIPAYRQAADLVVPIGDLDALLLVSLLDQAVETPSWVLDATTVGWRAELYSLRLERSRHGVENVLHTSRDAGDGFGYDLETTASKPSRLIEVKGSRSTRVSFVLTDRELAAARDQPSRYEIQFWAGLTLSSRAARGICGSGPVWVSTHIPRCRSVDRKRRLASRRKVMGHSCDQFCRLIRTHSNSAFADVGRMRGGSRR